MPFSSAAQAPHPSSGPDAEQASPEWPWQRILLVAVLMIVLLLVLLTWASTSEQRAVERMDPQARALLFQQTRQSFQLLCQQKADPGLASHCSEQARFLKKFPECQDECRQQLDLFNRASR